MEKKHKCVNREVKTSLGSKYIFRFFYADECALPDMQAIESRLKESKEIRIPTGMFNQFFVYNREKFFLPLTRYEKRKLLDEIRRKGATDTIEDILKHADITKEPDYYTKWTVQDLFHPPLTTGRWAGFLFHPQNRMLVAYAIGWIEADDIRVSLVETHPDYEGEKLCSTVMRNVFEELRKRAAKSISIENVAGLPGYYCYTGAAKANQYGVICHDCDRLEGSELAACIENLKGHPDSCRRLEFSFES